MRLGIDNVGQAIVFCGLPAQQSKIPEGERLVGSVQPRRSMFEEGRRQKTIVCPTFGNGANVEVVDELIAALAKPISHLQTG